MSTEKSWKAGLPSTCVACTVLSEEDGGQTVARRMNTGERTLKFKTAEELMSGQLASYTGSVSGAGVYI